MKTSARIFCLGLALGTGLAAVETKVEPGPHMVEHQLPLPEVRMNSRSREQSFETVLKWDVIPAFASMGTTQAAASATGQYAPPPEGAQIVEISRLRPWSEWADMTENAYYSTADSNWGPGWRRSTMEYKWVAPPVLAGTTVRWQEVFVPDNDAGPPVITPRSWVINGQQSSVFILAPDRDGTAYVTPPTTTLPTAELAVDANRDGTIKLASEDDSDATSEAQPYRFWLNDDDDTHGTTLTQFGPDGTVTSITNTETVPASQPDYLGHAITTARNLEDFARLWVDMTGMQSMVTGTGGIQVGLKWKNATGSPAINLYVSADATGSGSYLKANQAAYDQVTNFTYSRAITFANNQQTVNTGGTFVFPADFLQTQLQGSPVLHLLFEGAGIGSGELVLVLLKPDGTVLGEGSGVWLDLKNIKSMYQGPGTTFVQPADETPHGIVFVHGWNMSSDGSRSFAETSFKRLWHRGYKGRFAYFRWNTNYSDAFDNVPLVGAAVEGYLADYNGSERVAWQSGAALKAVVDALPSGYTHNLIAHSMGNIVTGSALLSGMTVDNYVLMQAAVPASCYDESAILKQVERDSENVYPGIMGLGFRPTFWEANASPDDDPVSETRALAYRGRLSADRGNLVSFYLPNDAATTYAWEFNNDQFKPATTYGYTRGAGMVMGTQQGLWKRIGSIEVGLNDPFEAMSLASRSWSKLVGAESRTTGAIKGLLDLSSETFSLPGETLGFKDEHSAEFNRNIQVLQPFYRELLRALKIPQNP